MSKTDANSLAVLPTNASEVESAPDTPYDAVTARIVDFLERIGMTIGPDMQKLLSDTVKSGAYYALKTLRDGQASADGPVPYSLQELMDMTRPDNTMLEVFEDMTDTEVAHVMSEMEEGDDEDSDHDSDGMSSVAGVVVPSSRTLH